VIPSGFEGEWYIQKINVGNFFQCFHPKNVLLAEKSSVVRVWKVKFDPNTGTVSPSKSGWATVRDRFGVDPTSAVVDVAGGVVLSPSTPFKAS